MTIQMQASSTCSAVQIKLSSNKHPLCRCAHICMPVTLSDCASKLRSANKSRHTNLQHIMKFHQLMHTYSITGRIQWANRANKNASACPMLPPIHTARNPFQNLDGQDAP